MITEVTTTLDVQGIPYIIRPHSHEVFTCVDAARERGVRLTQIVKCMIGKDAHGNLHVMMIPGDKMLKIKRVRQLAGGIAIDLLSPELIASELGLTIGAISPIQLIGRVKQFYADNSLFREEVVDVSAGHPNAGVELRLEDLLRLVKPIRCDIISTTESA